MGIVYLLTLILLGVSFMIFKKSEEKLNFIKWLIIFMISILGYNITLGMILGLLHIKSHILLLSLINICFSAILGFKAFKNKECQKYFVRKTDLIGILVVLVVLGTMFVKDLYIYKGDISHFAIDSAIHYRAAKHYSDNLMIFINTPDKTLFDFNVMQPGAYINDGIFMNVMHGITKIDYCYLYQVFETIVLFFSGLAFYSVIIDKIKTKRGFIVSFILFTLYIYGYPYNSWIYGFSYLSVGIALVTILIPIMEYLYSKEKISNKFIIPLIGITSIGIIFSYCLFVPAIFSAICVYVFIKDLKQEGKKYFKFFKINTIIITLMLVLITILGIGYLFIPTFFIEGQMNLVSALKVDGAIYSEKYQNFLPYIPFAIMYAVIFIKRFIKKELKYMDVFSVFMVGYLALTYIGMLLGKVSPYYMLKIYFIIWMVIFTVTVELINEYTDLKIFKWIGPIYICIWGAFVFMWVWIKAGHIIGEEEKHALKNYVGMYYSENCEYRKLIDMTQNYNKSQIELSIWAKENLKDLTADNLTLVTEGYYRRCWATVILELTSNKLTYPEVIQDTKIYSIVDALDDDNVKYIVNTIGAEINLQDYVDNGDIEVLYENDNGYVAVKTSK